MNHLHQSYSDVMNMPTIERRFFLETLHQQNIQNRGAMEEQSERVRNSGKGRRTRTVSGKGVANYSD